MESRFNRIEEKVDRIDDKVENVRIEVASLKGDMKEHMAIVQNHVAGDDKIISQLSPMLPLVKELTKDYNYRLENQKRRKENLRYYATKIGLASASLGIFYTIYRLFWL